MQYQSEPKKEDSLGNLETPRNCEANRSVAGPQGDLHNCEALQALTGPSGTFLGHVMLTAPNPFIQALPEQHRRLVEQVISTKAYGELNKAISELVKLGGLDSTKALVCLLSEATTTDGALAEVSLGGRHVVVYALCRALLKTAGATRLSEYESIHPERHLTKSEARDVWRLVHSLAKGDHGDIETATGARGLLFERFAELPGVGGILQLALKASQLMGGAPSGSPPKLLFVLYDLPWSFRSKLPFASVDSREGNLAEILFQRQKRDNN